jgi:hypothetical protein
MNLPPPNMPSHQSLSKLTKDSDKHFSPIRVAQLDEYQRSLPAIKVKADAGPTSETNPISAVPSSNPFLDALADLSISIDFAGFASALKSVRKHVATATSEIINQRAYLLCDDRTPPNTLGEYALFLLAEYGFGFDMEHCRQKGIDLNARDHRPGEQPTALMKAVQAENLSTALTLLKYATPESLQIQNSDGQTVMQIAEARNNPDLIKALTPFFVSETTLSTCS